MKFRSIIWTYLLFSVLHLSTGDTMNGEIQKTLSEEELKANSVNSTLENLSYIQKLELLSVFAGPSDTSAFRNDSTFLNGYVFDPKLSSLTLPKVDNFLQFPFHIVSTDAPNVSNVDRLTIGQSGKERLAFFSQAMEVEELKKAGANIVLGDYFQTYSSDWNNKERAFHESPISSEKFWRQTLQASEENGVKIGVNDFFYKKREIDQYGQAEFLAVNLSGNRYYARKGHGIIQLSDGIEEYKVKLTKFKDTSRQSFLRKQMDFDGIIIGEDLSDFEKEKQLEQAFKSIKEGTDIVCISKENQVDFLELLSAYFENRTAELNKRVKKILFLKYDLHLNQNKSTSFSQYNKPFEYQVKQAALTCVINKDKILPVKNLNDSVLYSTSSIKRSFYGDQIENYAPNRPFKITDVNQNMICILDGFGEQFNEALNVANQFSGTIQYVLLTDAITFHSNRTANLNEIDGLILSSSLADLDEKLAIQTVFGAYGTLGNLPFYQNPRYPQGHGIKLQAMNRLQYVGPEYLGMNEVVLNQIDEIAENGVKAGAYPGCQVQFAYDGKVVYQKNFGHHNYAEDQEVTNKTIYDIASITKIAASTGALMKLQSDEQFSLEDSLIHYIPEVVADNPMGNIWLKDMMAHQAGLPAWIPFYVKTLKNKAPNPLYYSNTKQGDFTVPVAEDLWIHKDYPDTMYQRILSCSLKSRTYKYSDLGYYFVKKIIEKQGGVPMEDFVHENIYAPLGLQTMTYNPFLKFDLERIAPTENDRVFRKQTVQGYVHDPGSAMMGGVCGHAGIFSTANDLSILMQMYLNGGSYGGVNIIKPEVINEFTSVQFPSRNRRGAGFDKPKLNGAEATACADVSPNSFGHSGFTGTLAWADPTDKINYVFLSNRVNPSAENWKIVKMDIRTNIQTQIYKAVRGARNYNFLVSI